MTQAARHDLAADGEASVAAPVRRIGATALAFAPWLIFLLLAVISLAAWRAAP